MVTPHAAGLIVIQGTRTLMVLKPFGKISIPGGKAENKWGTFSNWEHSRETAIRETFEETGLMCGAGWYPNAGKHEWQEPNTDFSFYTYIGHPYDGVLTPSNEGVPFWLELSCWKNIPSVLQYPEWTRSAIKHFKL